MVGLIAWGRFVDGNGNKVTVPAPSSDPGKPWLADMIRENAASIAASFDMVQWPPTSKAQGGAGGGCDGYGVFDKRDLGTKNQQGSVPTRYGSLESLMAAVAALNAYGTSSYGDMVLHQLIGENGGPGVFRYLGADGHTMNGRGATTPGWFRGGTGNNDPIPPFCREDDVPNTYFDYSFGREVSYQHCNPAAVTTNDALDWITWLTKRVGYSGYRYDDVKGTWEPAAAGIMWKGRQRILDEGGEQVSFYAEYFDGDPNALNAWATAPTINNISGVEDFTMHWRIQAACNGFNASQLSAGTAGYWQWRSDLAVGFVDNPDTDTSPGQQVIFNKGLAYAYALTVPCRLALVYGKDYFPDSVWPGGYGLKPLIDNLCWINRMFAFGACETRWQDESVFVLSRDGNGGPVGWSGGLLTALNFDTWNARTITCSTPFGPNRWLHDYTGHHPDIWTDREGNATFTIPSNAYSSGLSYLCFAPGGISRPYTNARRTTTHTFVGDVTLDVMPVRNGIQMLPQRLHCAADTVISAAFKMSRTGVPAAGSIQVELVGPDGSMCGAASTGNGGSAVAKGKAKSAGWYSVRLTGAVLPDVGVDFEIAVTYTGTA